MAVLADISSEVSQIVGSSIQAPTKYGSITGSSGGLILLLSNILRLVFVGAGIFAFVNFILAGFGYMTAAGDAKALTAAWSRIWQSLLGLVIIVGSFALATLISYIVFGDATFILNPRIYGPTQ